MKVHELQVGDQFWFSYNENYVYEVVSHEFSLLGELKIEVREVAAKWQEGWRLTSNRDAANCNIYAGVIPVRMTFVPVYPKAE